VTGGRSPCFRLVASFTAIGHAFPLERAAAGGWYATCSLSRRPLNPIVNTEIKTTGSAAHTFSVLWGALHDVMGSAATATLLRRAAKHASTRAPELDGFEVHRVRFEYRYVVPPSWSYEALGALMSELRPLLVELTGPVVLRRLHGIPELQVSGHFSPDGGARLFSVVVP
jgi:hypothetical protein